ncbi:MAG: hypothetical protein ACREEE_15185 [Dongiaceae bacterium]
MCFGRRRKAFADGLTFWPSRRATTATGLRRRGGLPWCLLSLNDERDMVIGGDDRKFP